MPLTRITINSALTAQELLGSLNIDTSQPRAFIAKLVAFLNGIRSGSGAGGAQVLASVTETTGAASTAILTNSGQPTANDTVTINGVVFTAVASGATGNQFNIGGNAAATYDNLVTAIKASTSPNISGVVTAVRATTVVTLSSVVTGPVGDTLTVTNALTNCVLTGTVNGKFFGGQALAAFATLTNSGQPTANDTMTINGKTITAKASGAVAASLEFNIAGSAAATYDNFVTLINASTVAGIVGIVTAARSTTVVTVSAAQKGAMGNAITITNALTNATLAGTANGRLSNGVEAVFKTYRYAL